MCNNECKTVTFNSKPHNSLQSLLYATAAILLSNKKHRYYSTKIKYKQFHMISHDVSLVRK